MDATENDLLFAQILYTVFSSVAFVIFVVPVPGRFCFCFVLVLVLVFLGDGNQEF